jgi:hypothetical protein
MSGTPPRWRSDWWWRTIGAVSVTAILMVSLALNAQFAWNQFASAVDKSAHAGSIPAVASIT